MLAKLTRRDVTMINKRRLQGYKISQIAKELNLSNTEIWKVVQGRIPSEKAMVAAYHARAKEKKKLHHMAMLKAAREDLRNGAELHVVANVYGLSRDEVASLKSRQERKRIVGST